MPIVFLAILPIYGQKTVHIFDEQGNKIFYSLDSSMHFFEFTSDVFEDQKNDILDSLATPIFAHKFFIYSSVTTCCDFLKIFVSKSGSF